MDTPLRLVTSSPSRTELERPLAAWGVALGAEAWERLDRYLQDVLEYNRKVNVTAAKDANEILRRHFADSLAALAPLRKRLGPAPRLLDVGSGAGFVGICLKIAWPEASMALSESAYRKYCFLNWAGARLDLAGLKVFHGRAETSAGSGYDAVLSRALAPLPEALELTLPLAGPEGLGLVYQTDRPDPASPPLASALGRLGGRLEEAVPYRLPGESRDRHLVLVRRSQ